MKVLFLYKRLASHLMVCVEELSQHVEEVHIVFLPPDRNAPFKFSFPENVFVHERAHFSLNSLSTFTQILNPDIILCSGWRDFGYMKVCRLKKGIIPTVLLMDNQWRNRIRQRLFCLFSDQYLLSSFSHVWVPGSSQVIYAFRLGFHENQIRQGLFCANPGYFQAFSKNRVEQGRFPRRFLFVGRHVNDKGLDLLIKAFEKLQKEVTDNWELWCVGQGPLSKRLLDIAHVKHFGFAQPPALGEIIRDCGVFVIPSRFEPWGVVVQEMVAAGFPVIASSEVGAGYDYLEDEVNGLIFKNGSLADLYLKMKTVAQMSDNELRNMANCSLQKAYEQTPQKWVSQLFEIIREGDSFR